YYEWTKQSRWDVGKGVQGDDAGGSKFNRRPHRHRIQEPAVEIPAPLDSLRRDDSGHRAGCQKVLSLDDGAADGVRFHPEQVIHNYRIFDFQGTGLYQAANVLRQVN